ncbi:MAG: hypothetical protein ACLGID_16530 [Gammaproteobacteria bacterium]
MPKSLDVEDLQVVDMLAKKLQSSPFDWFSEVAIGVKNSQYLLVIGDDSGQHFTLPLFSNPAFRIPSSLNVGAVLIENCVVLSKQGLNQLTDFSPTSEPHDAEHVLKFTGVLKLPLMHHSVWKSLRRLVYPSMAVGTQYDQILE